MHTLTDDGRNKVAEIADRHGVSSDAARQLLSAIAAGGGRQAQFDHPELGGMGQWSQGGMIMIGDMFNHSLKAQVAALCNDLAELSQDPSCFEPGEAQNRNPPGNAQSGSSFGRRWPAELGAPTATGSQNDLHYAVFPGSRRLAIERDGQITVYDTQDHRIGGVSQQQGGEQSLRFTSQSGPVRLSDMKIVGADAAQSAVGDAPPVTGAENPVPVKPASEISDEEIFSRIERLADLRSRDIITADEFAAKKTELLSRL